MPPSNERTTIDVEAERAIVAAVRLQSSVYDPNDPFGELVALAEQAGATVVGEIEQARHRPVAATFMGSGKLEELRDMCERLEATVVIFDHDLAPSQIGNIEKVVNVKVIDRSELILDIFAARASTRQAKLQVELAQLEYTYPRLRAMWTHLERIVGSGGIGGVGTRGPGEQQLEIDRRLVQRRRLNLQREIKDIQARKAREVSKRKQDHFTVGLVGYTNAGKSTLFNTLTEPFGGGGAYADDRVFATLHTRTRAWRVAPGVEVMLSDTVGFVRDLPHHLIASFRATLEEATHADLLLMVLDIADPAGEMHFETIQKTLDAVFREAHRDDPEGQPKRLLLLNKVDRLPDAGEILVWQNRERGSIPICALDPSHGGSGRGLETLTEAVRREAVGPEHTYEIVLALRESKAIHDIETVGELLDRQYEGDTARLRIKLGERQVERLRARGARFEIACVQ